MLRQLKTVARAVSPSPVRTAWGRMYGDVKIRRARRALAAASATEPTFLPSMRLAELMSRGYRPPPPVRYDDDGLVLRAGTKVAHLEQMVDLSRVSRAVELGAWDGMVSAELARRGIATCGLDLVMDGVDARAVQAGVRFLRSDAGALALGDASVDFMFSFGSLEHFPRPDRCLAEAARIIRPGGFAYFDFGPLYCSPYGRHAYRQIPIPFCHLLFEEQALRGWATSSGLSQDWPYVNGWTLRRYRALWAMMAAEFEVITYREHTTGGVGTELIAEYPACFRGRGGDFDEFLVSLVEIVLRRR